MKKILALILILVLSISALGEGLVPKKEIILEPIPAPQGDYTVYVSVTGDDANDGSESSPVKSISRALELAAALIHEGSVILSFGDGEFPVEETIVLDETNTDGVNGHILSFVGSGSTVLTGGVKTGAWEPDGQKNVWKTNLPGFSVVNGLYVDEKAQTLANQQVYGLFTAFGGKSGIVNKNGERFTDFMNYNNAVPLESVFFTTRDIYELDGPALEQDKDVFLLMTQTFMMQRFPLASIVDNDEFNFTLTFDQSALDLIDYAKMQDFDNSMDFFYLYNSRQFMDMEGEYWFDKETQTLYLYTMEDPNGKDCVVTRTEGLVTIEGTQELLAGGVRFDGISFMYGTDSTYRTHAFKQDQSDACSYAYTETEREQTGAKAIHYILPGQVYLHYATDVTFTDCSFKCMDTGALQIVTYTYDVTVDSCDFSELGGSGIICGCINLDNGWGITDKYDLPAQLKNLYSIPKKTNCTPANIRISNNDIRSCGNLIVGANGIFMIYGYGVDIVNNTIENVSGTGISLGWGWGNSRNSGGNRGCGSVNVVGNYVKSPCMKITDCGGIYTLGFFVGDGCYIADNYVDMKGAYDSSIPGIYLDQGSQYVYVTNNFVSGSRMWLSERGLPVSFDGSKYYVNTIGSDTMLDCIIDGNFTQKKRGTHLVYANYEWPSASTVKGANFIVGEETVDSKWQENEAIMAIVNGAGCVR